MVPLVPWYRGGTVVPWHHGTLVSWYHDTYLGAMVQWVETILHQFKDVGIVGFLVRTLQSTNQRMYLYLLFLQMAPLCSGCCGRTCEN